MIKIEEEKFYFLKDLFFEKMKDSNLAQNKDNENKGNVTKRINKKVK